MIGVLFILVQEVDLIIKQMPVIIMKYNINGISLMVLSHFKRIWLIHWMCFIS